MNIPKLNEGERYLCGIADADGTVTHTILLPGDNDEAPWDEQMDWAKSLSGDLPTRVEQAILYEEFKDKFHAYCYWSNTQHASDSDYAWGQYFHGGGQYHSIKCAELRARAVRRVSESNSELDLIEIGPYDDFKIDEPVMVQSLASPNSWEKRHFAGISKEGAPKAWDNGGTSWSASRACTWAGCRRPTPEEMK